MMGGDETVMVLVEISLLVKRAREIGALIAICLATEFADMVKQSSKKRISVLSVMRKVDKRDQIWRDA